MPPHPASTRATRSRFSSPLQSIGSTGPADAGSTGGGGSSSNRHGPNASTPRSTGASGSSGIGGSNAQRAMMARWLEPPVQSKTSFEEAGFQRHGVFEGMAPLGTLPKAVNVAKRISGLPEEKQYREGSPSGGRQSAKQQKKKELQGQQGRPSTHQQQPENVDTVESQDDGIAASTEQENQTELQEPQIEPQEEPAPEPEPEPEQPAPSSLAKKIILKRPSTGKHVRTRIIVGPRRSLLTDPETIEDDSAEDKMITVKNGSLPSTPTTPNTPATPTTRRSIIFRPAPGNPQPRARAATRQRAQTRQEGSPATEEEADDADQSDQEAGEDLPDAPPPMNNAQETTEAAEAAEPEVEKPVLKKPKLAKRPVGRPKSRRSIAAENRALKEKQQAEAEADAEAGAEAEVEAQAEAECLVVAAAEAQIEAETPPTPTTEAPKQPDSAHAAENEDEVRYSDGDSFDSQAEDGDGYGGKSIVFDSSHLPFKSQYTFHRPRSDSNATEVNREVTDRVVDIAVDEALRHSRYPTAWALRTLYDEQAGDQTFLTMVEDVFQQTADRDTLNTFVRMVHEKKKEAKKDNKACNYFAQQNADGDFAPQKPIPAPYADLITMDLPRLGVDGSEIVVDDAADEHAHAKKRVKLTNDDDEQESLAAEAPSVAMHTFAPPPTSALLPAAELSVDTDAGSQSPSSALRKTGATAKLSLQSPKAGNPPSPASVPSKTPTKTPRRPPGRPPGSKNKTLAEKAAAAATALSKVSAQRDDDYVAVATPSSSQRRLRHRAGSAASSISSLSSAMSVSPPSKALRSTRKDNAAAGLKTGDKTNNEDEDVVMRDVVNSLATSIGWTSDTVQQKAEKAGSLEEFQKQSGKENKEKDDNAKASSSATQQGVKRGRGGAERRARGGPGSGRGGRRRGAGRPPKNRTLGGLPPRTSPTAQPAEPAPAPDTTPDAAQQPIATRNRSSAKKSPTPSSSALISPSSSSQNNTQHAHTTGSHKDQPPPKRVSAAAAAAAISASAKDEMPAAVEDNISMRPLSLTKRAAQNAHGKGRSSTAALPSPALNSTDAAPKSLGKSESGDNDEERLNRLRREARGVTNSIGVPPESFARGDAAEASTGASSSVNVASASRSRQGSIPDASSRQPVLETPKPQRQRQLRASTTATRTTRSARKRAFDEVDDDVSPRSASFPSEEPSSSRLQTPVPTQPPVTANASNLDSRAGTPGPKSKKPRVGLRVKSSPVKKKTGTSAGVPRPSGERPSPVANGGPNSQDDNDDYCASCGGSGDLVCCDGCTRSFHFGCVDPPVHEDRDLPDEWFCNVCIGRRNPAALTRYTGIFGALLNAMEKRNSSAFRLPAETRDHFEGVKTGADGEYEDVVVASTSRTRKRGYEEAPDFFRIRDNDGNPVLCHQCNLSTENDRPIIPCAYCGLWWHIDCLDPPMANPPVLRNWRCPAHADDILAKLPCDLGPAHRFRKIKGAPVIKPAYSRGMINNGFIEFASDSDSDNNSGWKDLQSFGRVQRIGARGVQLDFLEQIRKEQSKGKQRRSRIQHREEIPAFRAVVEVEVIPVDIDEQPYAQVDRDVLQDRSFIDQAQAAHNLSALHSSGDQVDRTGDLINALLAQADAPVISMMAQGNALNIKNGAALTQEDRTALEAMRARIEFLLANPGSSASLEGAKEHSSADNRQQAVAEPQEAADIAMEDAHEDAPACEGEQAVPGADGIPDQAILEPNEVMSLVSDNGENEDEDPPPITTPLNAADEEPNSAVWPVEHHGSSVSDPDSATGTLPATTKTDLATPGIDGFPLCDHNSGKESRRGTSEPQNGPNEAPDAVAEQLKPGTLTNDLSSPLTPVRTSSETAVEDEDDKENEALTVRLDKQKEHQDGALTSAEVRTEMNDAANI